MSPPSRPSLEQQLRAAKVVHGSRLEQLIRDNQDFHLLRAREADDDKIRLPLWLRVFWRKNHPEGRYSADDPTGGYPLVLRNLYRWMLHNQDFPFDLPPPAAAPSSTPAAIVGKATGNRRRKGGKP